MSLATKALLVSLTITKPQMTKKDKDESDNVAHKNNADAAAIAVTKQLYPKALISPITDIESAARRYIGSVAGDSQIRGLNILPCKLFMDFQAEIGLYKLRFDQAVTVFMGNYANILHAAQGSTGALFDRHDYPDVSQIRREFSFVVNYIPIAEGSSVILELEEATLNELRATVEEQTKGFIAANQADATERLKKAVERIKTQCSKPEGKIYDTLTGNLKELLTLLPALNLGDDAGLSALCREAEKLVVSPEAIKTVPGVRESTAAEADRILRLMGAMA